MTQSNSVLHSSSIGVVQLAPTLEKMRALYQLSRHGGPASPRFQAYLAHTEHEPGMVAYNPMAGDAALEAVEALLALDAESLALATAQRVAQLAEYQANFTIALAVRSTGFWTHRIPTEVDERAAGKARTPALGIVSVWSRETNTANDVVRETAAECVRVMWTTEFGNADTLRAVLAREGLAYAIASHFADAGIYAQPLTDEATLAVINALEILGDSRASSDMAGVLFGDDAATMLGWTPLGIPEYAGYQWAVARAREHIQQHGVPATLRAGATP
jgi:hypothetical protein